MVNPVVFQLVGFQNSGKTTFVRKLLRELRLENYRAVTIKHHGHGGKPDIVENKDSYLHTEAGGIASLVEGEGRLIVQAENINWSLAKKIEFISFFDPDIILVEGHKYESFKKAVIVREPKDLALLKHLNNIRVIYVWDETLVNTGFDVPIFHINDQMGIQWLTNHLIKQL